MQQHINLYANLPKKIRPFLTKTKVLSVYSALIIVLFMVDTVVLFQKASLNKQVHSISNEVNHLQQQLGQLMQQYPMTDPVSLSKNIKELLETFQNKTFSMDLLLPYNHFSNYLLGLSKASTPGVWLTHIVFKRGEIQLALKGFALKPAMLETFYSNLTKEPIFSGMSFEVSDIEQTSFPASFTIIGKKVDKP